MACTKLVHTFYHLCVAFKFCYCSILNTLYIQQKWRICRNWMQCKLGTCRIYSIPNTSCDSFGLITFASMTSFKKCWAKHIYIYIYRIRDKIHYYRKLLCRHARLKLACDKIILWVRITYIRIVIRMSVALSSWWIINHNRITTYKPYFSTTSFSIGDCL